MAGTRTLRTCAVTALCWLVKGAGVAMLLLILAIFIGEGPPNPAKLSARQLLMSGSLLAVCVGFGLAVWRQLTGGMVILAGAIGITASEGLQMNWVFCTFWGIGLLNVLCWWLTKRTRS